MPLAAFAFWALYDLRAMYVCLIMIFLIFPLLMSFVWFNYAFSPSVLKGVATKEISITDSGLSVAFLDDGVRRLMFEDIFIKREDILALEFKKTHVSVVYGQRLDQRLIIPDEVLAESFKAQLSELLPKNNNDLEAF